MQWKIFSKFHGNKHLLIGTFAAVLYGLFLNQLVWGAEPNLEFPPKLPGGKQVVTEQSADFLKPTAELAEGVAIATHVPQVDFLYYPGQDYLGNPWSNWGDGLAADGKYYSAIGDHLAANSKDLSHGSGSARVFAYDPQQKSFTQLTDTALVLKDLPAGDYLPGKIHSRIDRGSDGALYFGTHRGSTRVTTDAFHYQGDWIFRCDPRTAKTEIVVQGPVPKHCIPNSVVDPERMIFYGGTASGDPTDKSVHFFAYDLKNRKLLYSGPDGPARYMMLAKSTGKLYFVAGASEGDLLCYDPAHPSTAPQPVPGCRLGIRAATEEVANGVIYAASSGQGDADAHLWAFDTTAEKVTDLGVLAVASQAYVATLDADASGRYLYYIPGAHGGSSRDGSPVIQFDTREKKRKVLCFLEPFFTEKYGATLKGTYGSALDPTGDKLFITWNVSRGSKAWDCCGLTVIHIPVEERRP